MNCELCGSEVIVVGDTTKHYERVPCKECHQLKAKLNIWEKESPPYDRLVAENLQMREALEAIRDEPDPIGPSGSDHGYMSPQCLADTMLQNLSYEIQKLADKIKALEKIAKAAKDLSKGYCLADGCGHAFDIKQAVLELYALEKE